MRRFITIGALAARLTGALCLSASAVAVAQGPGAEPEKCLNLNRIQKTEVIDDRNIIFYMRGGQIFRNQLSHRCSGLRKDNTIMYRPSLNRLCNLDFITVLRDFSFGFIQGPSYVVMSIDIFRDMMGVGTDEEMAASVVALKRSMQEARAGETRLMTDALDDLGRKYEVSS